MLAGFINVLKPPGYTSHDIVQQLRCLLKEKRIGHGGTLDPLAAGVLPVAVGQATRLLEYLQLNEKSYRAEYILGLRTDTQDLSGRVLSKTVCSTITDEDLQAAARRFTGSLKQVPPMASAVHYQGRRLYELARLGKEVERPARQVHIKKFSVIRWWPDGPYTRVLVDITCSKGTYVRTLGADWGDFLGCGATLAFLIRTRVGNFKLEETWTLEEIAGRVARGCRQFLLPATAGVTHLPTVTVKEEAIKAIINGAVVRGGDCTRIPELKRGNLVRLEVEDKLLALARVVINESGLLLLKPEKVFK